MNFQDKRARSGRFDRRLREKKLQKAPGIQPDRVVAGRIPVLECLKAGVRKPSRLYYLEGAKGIEAILAHPGVPKESCDRATLDALTQDAVHQGVVLVAEPLRLWTLREWLAAPGDVIVVLDGVEDPHNFGAIVRSISAFGGSAVLFGKDRAAPVSPASVKAAAGAMEHVALVQETNVARALEQLKEAGFWTYALDASGETVLWDAELTGKVALIVGSEGAGIRRLVLDSCDFRVKIPIVGAITSLNASVSAAVALAEWARQCRG